MRLITIESTYAGDVTKNIAHARECLETALKSARQEGREYVVIHGQEP